LPEQCPLCLYKLNNPSLELDGDGNIGSTRMIVKKYTDIIILFEIDKKELIFT
jgi:hypothetical protein